MGLMDTTTTATPAATQGAPEATQQVAPQDEIAQLKEQLRKKEEALTSKFHGLTTRERSLLQKEQELKARMGEIGAVDELRSLAVKDPLKLLERFGLNYDRLTDIYAGMTPEDETKKTVGTLKQEIEQLKAKLQEDQAQGQMKEIMRVKEAKLEALRNLANKDGSGYDLVSTFGNYDDVLAFMSEHYNATGEILSDEEALNHIESKLADSFKAVSSNPRVKKLLGLSEPEVKAEPARPFGLNDSRLKTETPRQETTAGMTDAQIWELALSKMPSLKS